MPKLRRGRKDDRPTGGVNTSDSGLHDWAMNMLEEGQQRRKPLEGQWWENIATFGGDLWAQFDPWKQRLWEPKPKDYKVRLPINLAQPVVRTEYAKLLKNRPILDVLAKDNDPASLHAAEVGDDMLNQYAEDRFSLPRVRRRALWWVLICGLGGVFIDYDEKAQGETEVLVDPAGQPIFDPRMISAIQRYYRDKKKRPKTRMLPQGDMVVEPFGPFNLIWDLSKIFFEEAWWCIYSQVYDTDEIFRRWGVDDVQPEEDALPGVLERRLVQQFDRTNKMVFKGSVKAQRLARVHRLYVRPGHRYFSNGAEIVFTQDKIISKSALPFNHNQLPFSVMGHIPFQVSQYSMSVLTQVKGPVLELSKTESQLVENRNMIANIPWIEYEQNRLTGEIQNRPGARLKIWFTPGVPDPHPVQMPEMPQYVQNLIPVLKEHILEISGQGETSQGRVPAGARSGVAIAYLQEEDDTKLGPTVQEFEEMIERMGNFLLDGFAQFYDAPRTIRIQGGRRAEPKVFDFVGTILDGTAGCKCQAGSALPRSKAAKQQFILDLFDRGLEQDPRRIREMLELSAGEPDEWEIDMEQAERENRELIAGKDPGVKEWYNHPAHHLIHRRFMKSADYEALPAPIQQLFEQHDEEHSQFERSAQQAQMVQQSMGGGAPGQNGQGNGNAGPPSGGGRAQLPASNGQNQRTTPAQFSGAPDIGDVQDYHPQ